VTLKVTGINTYYGSKIVLRDVTFAVQEGEAVALLGRNGAGKTTTLRSVMGLTPPRSGKIEFAGQDLTNLPTHQIANTGISYVPDDRRIFPDLTVEDNLLLADRLVPPGTDKRWSLDGVYGLFPVLSEFRFRRGILLSGGQQKMLALGRALMKQPQLLLLDEAAEGLAPLIVKDFVDILHQIRTSRTTILMADQNLNFARRVAERAYIIDKGRIMFEGSAQEIWKNEEVVQRYLAV